MRLGQSDSDIKNHWLTLPTQKCCLNVFLPFEKVIALATIKPKPDTILLKALSLLEYVIPRTGAFGERS